MSVNKTKIYEAFRWVKDEVCRMFGRIYRSKRIREENAVMISIVAEIFSN